MENLEELSIHKMMSSGRYIIPIYQRNYAWGEGQVKQLIQDVWDSAKNGVHNYFIGSLIVYERDKKKQIFETIDGQQRLTTLTILLSVLRNEFDVVIDNIDDINLDFDSRSFSTTSLHHLYNGKRNNNEYEFESGILLAYDVIHKQLKEGFENGAIDKEKFIYFLLNKVKIVRVPVPHDTDLNHYFEIMNNRGEQLEKHEILKASCMEKLSEDGDEVAQELFGMIWEACSQMERYIQYGFDIKIRDAIFGQSNWNRLPKDWDEMLNQSRDAILNKGNGQNDLSVTYSNLSIEELVDPSNAQVRNKNEEDDDEGSQRFNTIINFSNFLLHALRVYVNQGGEPIDVALDDKRLIDTFNEHIQTKQQVKEFGYALLRTKFLFDKYVLKRELNKDHWSLRHLKWYKENRGNYINTFSDERKNEKILMLLSMFHVSFPTLIYKHWLTSVLQELNMTFNHETGIDDDTYISFLEKMSDAYYYDRFRDDAFDYLHIAFLYGNEPVRDSIDEKFLHIGTGVQNFIFNRLDYLIWRHIKDGRDWRELGPSMNSDRIVSKVSNFEFSFRTSVEHFYPRNPFNVPKVDEQIVDRFGNLCLISQSINSRLSNHSPMAKKDHYMNSTAVESLKQQLMMSYDKWNYEPGNKEKIEEHEERMITLLNSKAQQ